MNLTHFTQFLKGNPELLSKYVSIGFTLVDKTVAPLNKLMQHLLEVQGIDPATQPGARDRKALNDAIDRVEDSEEYDKDFNFSRFHSKYEQVKGSLKHLNLTKDQYRKMTDLSRVDDVYPALIPQNSDRHEIRIFDEKKVSNPLDDLESFTKSQNLAPSLEASGNINIKSLKEALNALKNYAENLDNPSVIKPELLKRITEKIKEANEPAPKVDAARQPVVVGGTRVTKGRSTVVKSFKKGLFRRVEDK